MASVETPNEFIPCENVREAVERMGREPEYVCRQTCCLKRDDDVFLHRFGGILDEKYAKTANANTNELVKSIREHIKNRNPMIRAIAVKRAAGITTPELANKLIPLIVEAARSEDPYVRKTAALAILKIHTRYPELLDVYNLGLVMQNLLEDVNPNVVANALSAIVEINGLREEPLAIPSFTTIVTLLVVIEEASEWAQIRIIDYVTDCLVEVRSEGASNIAHLVLPRVRHGNPGVAMSAIRCLIKMCDIIDDVEFSNVVFSQVVPFLISLINRNEEIQYTALKTMSVVARKYKWMLTRDAKLFLCNEGDPVHIILEKLNIITMIAGQENVQSILESLLEYSRNDNVEISRKSIRGIERLALGFEYMADVCVEGLTALMQLKIPHIAQECIIVCVSVFRKYKGRYEKVIATIFQCLNIDEPEARIAVVWILGEYASFVPNALDLLDRLFLRDFLSECLNVQLAILTAAVKIYLCDPEKGKDLLKRVMSMSRNEQDNTDLSDRAWMYLCLITEASNEAKKIICTDMEIVELAVPTDRMNGQDVDALMPLLGTLSIVYGMLPFEFVVETSADTVSPPSQSSDATITDASDSEEERGDDNGEAPLLVRPCDEMFGLEIRGSFALDDVRGRILEVFVTNTSGEHIVINNVTLSKHLFGLYAEPIIEPVKIPASETAIMNVRIGVKDDMADASCLDTFLSVIFDVDRPNPITFRCPLELDVVLSPLNGSARMTRETFTAHFESLSDDLVRVCVVRKPYIVNVEEARRVLKDFQLHFIGRNETEGFFVAHIDSGVTLKCVVRFEEKGVYVSVLSVNEDVSSLIMSLVSAALK